MTNLEVPFPHDGRSVRVVLLDQILRVSAQDDKRERGLAANGAPKVASPCQSRWLAMQGIFGAMARNERGGASVLLRESAGCFALPVALARDAGHFRGNGSQREGWSVGAASGVSGLLRLASRVGSRFGGVFGAMARNERGAAHCHREGLRSGCDVRVEALEGCSLTIGACGGRGLVY
jgi:hypothetical protein